MDWQPIETAPKDGGYLLGYDPASAVAHGDPRAGLCVITWVNADEDDEWGPYWLVQPFADGLDCIESAEPTHWMTWPAPPLATGTP